MPTTIRPVMPLLLTVALLAAAGVEAQTPPPPRPAPPATQPPPAAAAAKTPAQPLPGARSIIDRHVAAIGGRAALAARKSTRATGTISIPSAGITGSIEIVAARPGRFVHRVTLPGVGNTEEGYDGKIGWSVNPMTGPRLLEGAELDQRREDADYDADLHNDALYESMTVADKTTFDGREVYKLILVLKGGREVTEFYEIESGLRAGVIRTDQSPMGPITSTIAERDYRRFGPLLQPTSLTVSAMGIEQVVKIDLFEFDQVPETAFAPPPAIQALVK